MALGLWLPLVRLILRVLEGKLIIEDGFESHFSFAGVLLAGKLYELRCALDTEHLNLVGD